MAKNQLATTQEVALVNGPLPELLAAAGRPALKATANFFTAEIANHHTARAYGRAVARFGQWCDQQGLSLESLEPFHVGTYIKELRSVHRLSIRTVKNHLAGIKHFFDYLATSQVIPFNPASAVRGPKLQVSRGETDVLTPEETYRLITSIDLSTIAGLRDRALISVMYYSFARTGAVLGDRFDTENPNKGIQIGRDYFVRGKTWYFNLHEKGNKILKVPAHHKAVECVDAYLEKTGIADQYGTPLFRALGSHRRITDHPLKSQKALEMLKRRAKSIGIDPKRMCNHLWRGTGITDYLNNGGTIEDAQIQAGHADIRTTKLYDHSGSDISIDNVEKMPSFDARPLSRIS